MKNKTIYLNNGYEEKAIKLTWSKYMLIYFIPYGIIVAVIISIFKKQFKIVGANLILWSAIVATVYMAVLLLIGFFAVNVNESIGISLFYAEIFILLVFSIFLGVMITLQANKVELKVALQNGYNPVNADEETLEYLETNLANEKYPWWAIIK